MVKKTSLSAKIFLAAFIFFPGHLLASGFVIYNQDAKSVGMGTSVTSSIDNPSAIFYNPALLSDQPGFNATMNDNMIMLSRTFEDAATGAKADLKTTTHHVPNLFANYTKDKWSFGIGIYAPFGLSVDWGRNWIGRYTSTFAELKTTFVTPTVAYKFNDYVSAGFGVSFVDSSLDFQNALQLTPFPDGRSKMKGDGEGIGVNAGVRMKLPENYTFSFTARSPVNIKYDGTAKFYTPNDSLLKEFFPELRNTDVSTRITFPWQLSAGLAKQIGPLTLEADVVYIGWSTIDKYKVKFSDGRPQLTLLKDWENAFTFALGGNYRWSKSLETQLGYMYDMSAAPRRTMSPDLPDADKHILTGGIGYTAGPFRANLAYQGTFYKKVSSLGNVVGAPTGHYEQFTHMVLVGFSFSL